MDKKSWVEKLPYPSGLVKWLYKTPVLLYRLGLGFLVGRLFMIMTTVGRKSGQPRRTAIEFHEYKGCRYVFSAWGTKADWYRNIEANPYINIQTWRGPESVLARRVDSDVELTQAFDFAMSNPSMRMVMKSAGFGLILEQFLAQKDHFTFVTFDPTDHPTPMPLRSDLVWVWAVLWILAAGTSAILAAHFLNSAFPFFTLLWLIIPLIAVFRNRDSALIGLRRIPLKDFVIVSIAATLASSAIVLLFEPWSHTGQMLYKLAISSTTPDATFLWLKQFTGFPGVIAMIVYGGLVTLFAEELFFRGWLQLWLLQRLPTVWAILIQATVFTILVNGIVALFMPPLQAIVYLVVYSWLGIGVVNGWAAARTRSIWPGLVAAMSVLIINRLSLKLEIGMGISMIFVLPIILNEIFMGIWLIAKGFNPSAINVAA